MYHLCKLALPAADVRRYNAEVDKNRQKKAAMRDKPSLKEQLTARAEAQEMAVIAKYEEDERRRRQQ